MPFASTQLASRIERAECALITECVEAARRRRDMPDAFITPIAGGIASFLEPGSPANKVAGLGFHGEVDPDALEEIEQSCALRDCSVRVDLSTLADPSVGTLLTQRGYVLRGFENVLGHALEDAGADHLPDGVTIGPSGEDELEQWMHVDVTGFLSPDTDGIPAHESFERETLERIFRDMATCKGMSRLLARRDDEPAGAASLRIDAADRIAQLCGATTLPAHRRRGIQSALLRARLAEARSRGCDLALMTALPGSTSQHNAQRQGFALLYTRAILVKEHGKGDS